jgi:XTP/dITP diphosphohydrolase
VTTTAFILATANPDKAGEIAAILGGRVRLLPRPPEVPDVDETADTLVGNALLKARTLAEATAKPAIADDTGLEVEALGGAPGVYSSRYSGEGATYAENVAKLIAALAGKVSPAERRARFATVAVAVWPGGDERIAEGAVNGTITAVPRGEAGFGYDPVFVPDEGDGRTFAEMTADEKHVLSHRGRAFLALADLLERSPAP